MLVRQTFWDITKEEIAKYDDLMHSMSVYPNEHSIISTDDKVIVKIADFKVLRD